MSGGQIQSIFSLYCELKYARSSIVKMCLVRHNHYVSRGQRRWTHCIIFMTAELTGSDTELRGRGREYLNIYALDTTDVETFPYSSYIYLQSSCRKYLHSTETPLHCMIIFNIATLLFMVSHFQCGKSMAAIRVSTSIHWPKYDKLI